MAVEKALFTTQADFQNFGIGVSAIPFMHYNSDDSIGWTKNGTTAIVPGVKGNAETYATGFNWKQTGLTQAGRHIWSVWIKPSASDISLTDNIWHIIATTRGYGQTPDRGLHLGIYNSQLNVRVYSPTGGADSKFSTDVGQSGRTVQADTLYHIIVKYDALDTTARLEVFVHDGVSWSRWIFSAFNTDIGTFDRKVSVGDFPSTTTGNKTYAFNGFIDEFMWFNGAQMPTINELQTTYHDYIMTANWIDTFTEPGSMILGGNYIVGGYTTSPKSWYSPTIDLGANGFGDYGRLQINYLAPLNTTINFLTRSSPDGSTWNNWIKVAQDGMINSPDERFLQIWVEMITIDPLVTPKVMEIQVLDYPTKKRLTLTSEPLIIYRDKATGLERMGELKDAYDIFITEEINGEESLEFKMAVNDPKRKEMGAEPVEMIAQIGDKRFIIRNPVDKSDESGKKYTQFFAEAQWYELRDAKVILFESIEDTARNTIQKILNASIEPTGWIVAKVDPIISRTIRGEWKSVLELLHEVRDQFGGELKFDTIDKTISLITKVGENNGVRFYYNKNLKSIERSVDTFNLITRLYPYGKNGMTINSVNNNVEYLQDTTWVDALNLRNRIRIGKWSDGRYTIPQNLKDDSGQLLSEWSKPAVAYAMAVNDLSMLSGHEHESIGLGDTVFAVDTELLNLLVESRIVKWKRNIRQPWKTEVELNQPKKELADANRRAIDDAVDILAETNPIDTSDVQQMTVFNHLLNSRAEDGIVYWEQTGTGITNEIGGFSGNASWKVVGGYGSQNILKQSIFGVSHRSAYTVSAYVYNEGTITRGATQDAFVGIRVRIHYTTPDANGKTYEDHLLAIPDITQQGGV